MTSGSCPRCRSALEEGASFCHSCGLDLHAATGPMSAASPSPAPYQPGFATLPMMPAPGTEVPATPLDHERALASIASIVILFTASIVFIFGLIYLSDRAIGWEETFDGGRWDDRQVIYWEWVMAGVLFIASFGAGIAGGIATAKVKWDRNYQKKIGVTTGPAVCRPWAKRRFG